MEWVSREGEEDNFESSTLFPVKEILYVVCVYLFGELWHCTVQLNALQGRRNCSSEVFSSCFVFKEEYFSLKNKNWEVFTLVWFCFLGSWMFLGEIETVFVLVSVWHSFKASKGQEKAQSFVSFPKWRRSYGRDLEVEGEYIVVLWRLSVSWREVTLQSVFIWHMRDFFLYESWESSQDFAFMLFYNLEFMLLFCNVN